GGGSGTSVHGFVRRFALGRFDDVDERDRDVGNVPVDSALAAAGDRERPSCEAGYSEHRMGLWRNLVHVLFLTASAKSRMLLICAPSNRPAGRLRFPSSPSNGTRPKQPSPRPAVPTRFQPPGT